VCNSRLNENICLDSLVGLYLSDLTFINDGNPTFLPDGKVNWKKMKKLATVLLQMQNAQNSDYKSIIQPDLELQNFLFTELYILNEKALYQKSRALEPPELQTSKK
jgi:son of sevenless-like protein